MGSAFAAQERIEVGLLCLEVHVSRTAVLFHVVSCEAAPHGTHAIVVRPYGLDGAAKASWEQLVDRARAA